MTECSRYDNVGLETIYPDVSACLQSELSVHPITAREATMKLISSEVDFLSEFSNENPPVVMGSIACKLKICELAGQMSSL